MVIQTHKNPIEMQDSTEHHHDVENLMRAAPNVKSPWVEAFRKSCLWKPH